MKILAILVANAGIGLLGWGCWEANPTFGKIAIGILLVVSGIAYALTNQPKK